MCVCLLSGAFPVTCGRKWEAGSNGTCSPALGPPDGTPMTMQAFTPDLQVSGPDLDVWSFEKGLADP